ncbi:MAG: alpha/beta fold hydrolase [Candidatus Hodarchaeota archaeon]
MSGMNIKLLVLSLVLISPCLANCVANPMETIVQNQNPILFIHGWKRTADDWVIMKSWFQANGWPSTFLYAINFDNSRDSSFQGNINNANEIKQSVDEIMEETGAEKVDLISHSMGGLSSRYYIKFLGGVDTVDDYVSIGAPHHGEEPTEPCESCKNGSLLLLTLNEGDETPGGILNDTLGDRVAPYSGIIYNGTHIPGNISYTSIYSLTDGDVPPDSSPLHGAKNISVTGPIHSQLCQDRSVYELVRAAVDNFNTTFLMTPPISLKAVPGESQIILQWQKPVDDGGAPITEYRVYRAATSGGPYFFIGNTTTLSYTDLNVTNEVVYYYVVTGVNSIGESDYSSEISGIPQPPISTTTSVTTSTSFTTTPTTTAPTSSSNILFLLLCLYVLSQLRPPKKR